MSTAFSDNAIGQTVHLQRVEITRVIDGNGANPCPPFQGPGLPPAGECDQVTVSKKITISFRVVAGVPNVGFLCSIDGKAFASWTSPITFNNLALGYSHFHSKRQISGASKPRFLHLDRN